MSAGDLPPAGALALLQEVEAGATGHRAGRSLLDHLLATWRILRAWHEPQAVALAGLYHSIYGTEAFEHACLHPGERERARVREAIGEEAERLAFLFAALEREAFLASPASPILANRFGDPIVVNASEVGALADILLANELDLVAAKKGGRPDKVRKKVGPVFAALEPHLSPAAVAAYRAAAGEAA